MLMLSETKSKKQQLGLFVYLSCPWLEQSRALRTSISFGHTVTEKIAMTSCCTQQILLRRRARPVVEYYASEDGVN